MSTGLNSKNHGIDRMIGITVSTNYADILAIVLPQNIKFFTEWIIVTSADDAATIKLITESGFKNIELLYFDFKKGSLTFNKGGAIRMCQQLLESRHYSGEVLIIDSDIYLPDTFSTIFSKYTIHDDTLFSPKQRNDFYSFKNFKTGRIDKIYHRNHFWDGFFHLYKHNKRYLYNDSISAAKCDDDFILLFRTKIKINELIVSHLGRDGVNWNGRKTCDFEI